MTSPDRAALADERAEHIGPINGRINRGPDILANGCLGVVATFFLIMIFCAIAGPYLP